ncbi:MAG: peptide deformylase [Clostridia bacterium]
MAVRRVFKLGDDVLRKKCKPVEKYDERLYELLDDLQDTLHEIGGLGLAAPQVGMLRRVCIVESEDKIYELINPTIIYESKEQLIDNEGCLSIEEYRGIVRRAKEVKVHYYDRFGNECDVSASDYEARAFLHEIDHLDGILFVDKMIRKAPKN